MPVLTPPEDWTDGVLTNAAMLNQRIRDKLRELQLALPQQGGISIPAVQYLGGAAMATFNVPMLPVTSRATFIFAGMGGYAAANNSVNVQFTSTGGGTLDTPSLSGIPVGGANTYIPLSGAATLNDIPANSAGVQVVLRATTNAASPGAYFRGHMIWTVSPQ